MAFSPLSSNDQSAIANSGFASQVVAAIEAAGIAIEYSQDGYRATDVDGASAIINNSGGWLAVAKAIKRRELDEFLRDNFDLISFIMGGSATVNANQVGTFLANITNNYRSIKASIAAQTTVAGVVGINVAGGWPNNP